MNAKNMQTFTRNQIVRLAIPASRPVKTLDGNLHEAGHDYKVLGLHGVGFVRLSRKSDCAKIIIEESMIETNSPKA